MPRGKRRAGKDRESLQGQLAARGTISGHLLPPKEFAQLLRGIAKLPKNKSGLGA
jgi:hypothetical protein